MAQSAMARPQITPTPPEKRWMPSEEYRAMLVRDGERRFCEWHSRFLQYQQRFLAEMAATRKP